MRVCRNLCAIGANALVLFVFVTDCQAEIFAGSIGGPNYTIYTDSYVNYGVKLEFDNINIPNNLLLENHGEITSNINVAQGVEFSFQNSDTYTSVVYLGANSSLIQVVKSDSDIGGMTAVKEDNSMYVIKATGEENIIDFASLAESATNADKLIIEDSTLHIDMANFIALYEPNDTPISLSGDICLVIDNWASESEIKLFNSDNQNAGSLVASAGSVGLLAPALEYRDGAIWLVPVRETDYEKILQSDRGRFLNQVRRSNPNSRMLYNLDNQTNMQSLYIAMDSYAAFNPIKLMNPVRSFVAMDNDFLSSDESGSIGAGYIFSGDSDIKIADVKMNFNLDGIDAGGKAFFGLLNDYFNESSAKVYGASVWGKYDFEDFYVSASTGFIISNFETGPILYNGNTETNPTGTMFNLRVEMGTNFVEKEFYFNPFIHMRGEIYSVFDETAFKVYPGIGGRFGYIDEFAGLKTNRSVFVLAESDEMQIGAGLDFMSSGDDLSFGIYGAMMSGELGRFYKIGVELKAKF